MPFKPLVTAGIETALNTFLWRDKALKPARQRLLGKVLRVELKELSTPVVLVFSERQVDVLGAWEGDADCTVITRLSVLPQLRNRQQLTALIRSGDLEVQGDLQVVQNTVALCDLAEFDPAELLAPYTGDIVAERQRLLSARWPHWKNGWKRWRANDARRITAPVFHHPHLFEQRAR